MMHNDTLPHDVKRSCYKIDRQLLLNYANQDFDSSFFFYWVRAAVPDDDATSCCPFVQFTR